MSKYLHGAYSGTASTSLPKPLPNGVAQCVIGTAPVHMLDNPSAAVNMPVLCEDMTDCENKIGYSEDFEKYTLCQSMYTTFKVFGVAPIVFINVLDPSKHCIEGSGTLAVENSTATAGEDIIPSTLVVKSGANTLKSGTDYTTEWVDGILMIYFSSLESGSVEIEFKKVAPSKVTASDIIGAVDSETGARSGMEVIRRIFPMFGYVPFILTAPGWSDDDKVGAMLAEKTKLINGCYTAKAILDLKADTAIIDTVITEKQKRTYNDNCMFVFPVCKIGAHKVAYSAYMSALIMYLAATTEGVVCSNPSNRAADIDDVILSDGTPVYYDQEDGNELNAEGIVTFIARNGWHTWGNNMACYPKQTAPEKRWIVASFMFAYNDNDFINTAFANVDGNITRSIIDDAITERNIKLAAWTASGYILGGEMYLDESDNTDDDILNGHIKYRTKFASNIPMEYVENKTEFDLDIARAAIIGGDE